MNVSDSVDEIVRALARYLRLNPLASDTLQGITQWWLSCHDFSPADLARALESMERAGVVESMQAADGQVRYRRSGLNAVVDAQLDQFISGMGIS